MSVRLCILENGVVPEGLEQRFATYPEMIKHWLSGQLPDAEFTTISPLKGQPLPPPEAFDGYLLTGSPHGVYEDLPWIQAQIEFLQQVRDLDLPIFGICFGHQLMAQAFGGQVRKAEQGWGVGAQQYDYQDGCGLSDAPVLIFHQDQVQELPDSAHVVGASGHCRHGALEYSFAARSVQYHPEFSADYVQALVARYHGTLLPEAVADQALASLEQLPVNSEQVARWAAELFRKPEGKA